MDKNSYAQASSLRISTEVVEKIAEHAALEVKGVHSVVPGAPIEAGVWGKLMQPKAVVVKISNGVADIAIALVVETGAKIPELSENVQKGIKDAVQSMTSITVVRVDVLVVGLSMEQNT